MTDHSSFPEVAGHEYLPTVGQVAVHSTWPSSCWSLLSSSRAAKADLPVQVIRDSPDQSDEPAHASPCSTLGPPPTCTDHTLVVDRHRSKTLCGCQDRYHGDSRRLSSPTDEVCPGARFRTRVAMSLPAIKPRRSAGIAPTGYEIGPAEYATQERPRAAENPGHMRSGREYRETELVVQGLTQGVRRGT